jgi:hypothetical protein
MKSWVAAPSLFCAGSSVDQEPEYPELSRTVIEPPSLGADDDDGEPVALAEAEEVGLVEELLLL